MQKYFPYKRMNHREILLYGFHFSFIFIFTLAVIRDVYLEHYFNASVNFSALFMSCLSYYLLHFKGKVDVTSNIIMAIAVIPLYTLIYFNHFGNMVIVYVILLPIAVFFLMDFKKALIINFFMYLLLIAMLYYISLVNPEAPILNNPLALINIAFASMFIMFFGIFYHLAIDSSISALIHSNRQKDILLKEVHHRVKNNLNVIASILGLQSMGKSEEMQEELLRTKSRIESIAVVHEMLYKQHNFEEIEFTEYVEKLNSLVISMQTSTNDIKIEIQENEHVTLPLNMMVQFGLIINEMLTNTIKHSKNSVKTVVNIGMTKKENSYNFFYRDNGEKSLDVDALSELNSLGLKLIRLSVKQLNGEMKISYENGLKYEIDFKQESF